MGFVCLSACIFIGLYVLNSGFYLTAFFLKRRGVRRNGR